MSARQLRNYRKRSRFVVSKVRKEKLVQSSRRGLFQSQNEIDREPSWSGYPPFRANESLVMSRFSLKSGNFLHVF